MTSMLVGTFAQCYRVHMWRDIPGYEGRYQVNEEGEVYSLLRRRLQSQCLTKSGSRGAYMRVNMTDKHGRRRSRAVHSMVMLAFVGPRPEGMETRHLDGNVRNNKLSNLAYGTHMENVQDAKRHGRYWLGRKHWHSVLTDEIVREARRLRSNGMKIPRIAEVLGVNKVTIGHVIRGYTWSHVK